MSQWIAVSSASGVQSRSKQLELHERTESQLDKLLTNQVGEVPPLSLLAFGRKQTFRKEQQSSRTVSLYGDVR